MTPLTPCPRATSLSAALLGSLLLLAAGAAHAADVFKCAGGDGIPVYQDLPCTAGRELRNFQTDPPAITILPAPELTLEPRAPTNPTPSPRAAATGRPPATGARAAGDPAERRFLRRGMTEGEVIVKVGPPAITRPGGRNAATHWTYLPAPGDPETVTIVVFSKGIVTDIERKVSR
jgi:hypothetical protein